MYKNNTPGDKFQEATQPAPDALIRHWRQAIGILAKRDAKFVCLARNSKGAGLPRGWNKPENLKSAKQALAHLDAGGNVGLAAGTGNLYILDFDRDAGRGYECEHLDGALHFRRPNAPWKAKFVFSCPDPIPTRTKRGHGIDLLGVNSNGTHWQGVIAGVHASGAPILWGGHHIPELPRDTVAALWEEWTGSALFAPERAEGAGDPTYADADLARVADALRYVDPNAIDYLVWQGIIAALHDAFGDEALDLAVEWADGKPGEVEAKWGSYDREYTGKPTTLKTIFFLARKAGWPDTWLQDRLLAYRRWLASPAAIETLKEAGCKTPERARKLLDTILQRCEQEKRLRVRPGYAWLARESSISQAGIGAYLARLYAAELIQLHPGGEGKPMEIELVLHILNASAIGSDTTTTTTPVVETVQDVQNWNVYREHRPDELFINNHHAYIVTHPQAELPPLGDNGLPILLALLDGPLTSAEAAAETGHSYHACARVLRRYVAHGVVDVTHAQRNRKTYTLKEEWRTILEANRPRITTHGVLRFRHDKALEQRERYLRRNGEDKKADDVQAERARLKPTLDRIREEAGIIPFPPRERRDKHQERRRRLTLAYLAGERALYRPKTAPSTEAARWRRRYYSAVRPLAERDWREFSAWALVRYGPGWWVRKDITDVLGQYRLFEMDQDYVPPIRWAGDSTELAAAAD